MGVVVFMVGLLPVVVWCMHEHVKRGLRSLDVHEPI